MNAVNMKLISSVCGLLIFAGTLSASVVDDRAPRFIKSNAVTRVKRSASGSVDLVRHRRQAQTLTTDQKQEILDRHNTLRRTEGASDMELLTWNDFLADLGVTWAAGCDWRHGQPPLGDNPQYTDIGQNLYALSYDDLTAGIQLWYDEKADYDYDSTECDDGKVCGHYTQMVWSSTREIGCGYHYCTTLTSSQLTNVYYLVCNYGPPGNYANQKPYTKGPACSKCGSGAGWCTNGLCNSACSGAGEDCTCAAICYNCGRLDEVTCRCTCDSGWHGTDCAEFCEDTNSQCNANPGWPPSYCNHAQFGSTVRAGCPVMCGLCVPDASAVPGECPPVTVNGTLATTPTTTPTTTTATASMSFMRHQHATVAFAVFTIALMCLSANIAP